MKRLTSCLTTLLLILVSSHAALAFCGFYVAKADTKLFNQASQVVLVRNDDRTVLTMANDFRGDLKEFAIVVPSRPCSSASRSTSAIGQSCSIWTPIPRPGSSSTSIRIPVRPSS